jgi:hypothetical protein
MVYCDGMSSAVPSFRTSTRYVAPDPHRAPVGLGPVSCAEATTHQPAYPLEAAILRADALAMGLAAAAVRVALPLSRAAAAFVRAEGWCLFGYARLEDCARERFSRSGTRLRQLAQVGEAVFKLEGLGPAMTGDDGGPPLGTEKARAIGQVATAETLGAWVVFARRLGVRELRVEVARVRAEGSVWPPGDGPRAADGARPAGAGSDAGGGAGDAEGGAGDAGGDAGDAGGSATRAAASVVDDGAGPDDRELVRLLVPVEVAAAFEETLDLYRAVVGHESTVTSFIEALVADAMAGGQPPEPDETADRVGLNHTEAREITERALEHSTSSWSHLPATADPGWALELAGASLRGFAELASQEAEGDAAGLEARLRALLEMEDELDRRLGEVLVEMGEMGSWSRLRFKDVEHYARRRLGMSAGCARERVRAARAMRRYAVLRRAYETGRVGLSASLQIVRLLKDAPAGEAVQTAWAEHAEMATVKRLRDEARALHRRRAMGTSKTGTGRGGSEGEGAEGVEWPPLPMTDAQWRASLRREAGMARARVARLGQQAAARVEGSVRCEATADVFLRLRLPAELASDFLATLEASRRHLSALVAGVPWDEPSGEAEPPGSVRAAREFFIRCRKVPLWAGLLHRLEEFVATWDRDDPHHRTRDREVHVRAGYRCEAAGCTSRCHLHSHHLNYLCRCGGEELTNKAGLCEWHHLKGEHGGYARFIGQAPLGVYCRLGRKDVGQWFRNEMRVPPPV